MNNLGLAYRAGKVVYGTTKVIQSIQNNKAHLVIIASDASFNTKKKLTDKCHFYQVDYMYALSNEMSQAIGKSNIMTVSILDPGFKKLLKKE